MKAHAWTEGRRVGGSRLLQNKGGEKGQPECLLYASCPIILSSTACMHACPSMYHRRAIICLFVCPLHWTVCSLHVRSNVIYYLPVTKHYLPVTSTKPSILIYWLSKQANVLTINISTWWVRSLQFRVMRWLIQATEIIQVGKWLKGLQRIILPTPPGKSETKLQRKALDCLRDGPGRENVYPPLPETKRSQSSENGNG